MVGSVFKAFAWSTIGRLINAVTKFLSVPLMLSHYGKDNYGLIALAFSVNVYMQIMDMGFNIGNVKFISSWIKEGENQKINKLIQSSLTFYSLIGLINFTVLIVVSFFSKSIFGLSEEDDLVLKKLFYILAFSSILSWFFSITNQVLKAYEKIDYDEKLTLITNVLAFILVIISVSINLNLVVYFLVNTVLLLSMYPIRVLKCKELNKEIVFKFGWYSDVFKKVIRYSINVFLLSIFQFSATNLRPIILGIKSDVSDVSDYRILQQITSLILIFTGSLMGILLPITSKLDSNDKGNAETEALIIYDFTKIITILLSFLVFGLVLISKPFLLIYIGSDYLGLTMWLSLWAFSFLGNHIVAISAIVLAKNNLKTITYFTVFSCVVSLLICWFFCEEYKIGGVVFSIISYSLLQLLFYYTYYYPKVMRLNSKKIFITSFLIPTLIGMASFFIVDLMLNFFKFGNNWSEIFSKGFVYVLLFFIAVNFFSVKIKDIKNIIQKR